MNGRFFKKSFFFSVFLLFIIAIGIHIHETNEPVNNFKISESAEAGISEQLAQAAEFNPQRVKYKDIVRWAVDIEDTSYPSINTTLTQGILEDRHRKFLSNCPKVLSPSEISKPINSKEFLISDKYKLIWCNIFKSASSSWLYNFLLMVGVKQKDMKRSQSSPIEYARKYYARPTVEKLTSYLQSGSNFTSFIIVRDPYERLLSAYRDKIESQTQVYYKGLRCKIEKTYGHPANTAGIRDCKPSFPAFVDYLVDEHAKENAPNEHWAPYYSFCSPCQVEFDYILHFETLSEDEALLVRAVYGLGAVVTPHKVHSSHTNYKELTQSYFKLLSQGQLEKLFNIYENDFKLFDYDYNKYFSYGS